MPEINHVAPDELADGGAPTIAESLQLADAEDRTGYSNEEDEDGSVKPDKGKQPLVCNFSNVQGTLLTMPLLAGLEIPHIA